MLLFFFISIHLFTYTRIRIDPRSIHAKSKASIMEMGWMYSLILCLFRVTGLRLK